MIPYPYNMVDMGGIDLAEANGTVVDGLYAKIVEAVNACGDVVLYNWKFAGIEISPQHTSILMGDPIIISGAVQVTAQDEVTVPGINPEPPPPPVIIPLSVTENGTFSADDYDADGFDPVAVSLPPPVLASLTAESNGLYLPPAGAVGFSQALVNVGQGSNILLNDFRVRTESGGTFSYEGQVTIPSSGSYFIALTSYTSRPTVSINNVSQALTFEASVDWVFVFVETMTLAAGDIVAFSASGTGKCYCLAQVIKI